MHLSRMSFLTSMMCHLSQSVCPMFTVTHTLLHYKLQGMTLKCCTVYHIPTSTDDTLNHSSYVIPPAKYFVSLLALNCFATIDKKYYASKLGNVQNATFPYDCSEWEITSVQINRSDMKVMQCKDENCD